MKTEATTDRRDEVALFRYGLIADLTHMEPGEPGTYARLKDKAKHRYAIPGSHRTGVAAETMRGWLRAWRKGGFDALRPKPRADQGQARAIPQEVTDLLCTIKEDKHELSVKRFIVRRLRRMGAGASAGRSVYRGRRSLWGVEPLQTGRRGPQPGVLCQTGARLAGTELP